MEVDNIPVFNFSVGSFNYKANVPDIPETDEKIRKKYFKDKLKEIKLAKKKEFQKEIGQIQTGSDGMTSEEAEEMRDTMKDMLKEIKSLKEEIKKSGKK